ncbi:YraN family protein [Celeribacter baekdonensis]|uniref:YraN family protein n=1 Tax=Celeribacter baekdonensis TaxID=875171 RepID=UPI003A90A93A
MPLDFVGYDPISARQTRGRMAYEFGHSAEACVARHYAAQGYDLAQARWRGRGGEIDLIFHDGDGFIFVEVKASKTLSAAAAHLGPKQIARICASAEDYIGLQPKGLLTDMRIDVALVDGQGHVEILENALM